MEPDSIQLGVLTYCLIMLKQATVFLQNVSSEITDSHRVLTRVHDYALGLAQTSLTSDLPFTGTKGYCNFVSPSIKFTVEGTNCHCRAYPMVQVLGC